MVEMIRDSARLYWRREQTSGVGGGVVWWWWWWWGGRNKRRRGRGEMGKVKEESREEGERSAAGVLRACII